MIFLLALLLAFPVYAENNNGNRSNHGAVHHNDVSGSTETSVVIDQRITGGDQISTSGPSSSKAIVGDLGGGASTASTGDVTIKNRRNAPSVYAGSPSTTAICWVGLSGGGSGPGFGVSALFARRDRACLAMLQFTNLTNLDQPEAAAKAYCVIEANLWKPFESIEACEVAMNVPRGTIDPNLLLAQVDVDAMLARIEALEARDAEREIELAESKRREKRAVRASQSAREQREVEQTVRQDAWADIKPIVLEK